MVNVSILSNDGQELASYKKNIKTRINNDVVDIKLSTENWTKGPIKVTLEYENIPQAYKIQYKIGKEEYKDYTGNMSELLIAEYRISQMKEQGILPDNGMIIKTIVSSNLTDAIA